MNSAALHYYLDCLSRSVLHAEEGNRLAAEADRLGAASAAILAFPAGTRESRALGVIMRAAGRVAS